MHSLISYCDVAMHSMPIGVFMRDWRSRAADLKGRFECLGAKRGHKGGTVWGVAGP